MAKVCEYLYEAGSLIGDKAMLEILKLHEESLANNTQIELSVSQRDRLKRYINALNIALSTIATQYLHLYNLTSCVSNSDAKIDYPLIGENLYEIIKVKESATNKVVDFFALPFSLYLPKKNTSYDILYSFLPKRLKSLDEEVESFSEVPLRVVSLLMASDLSLASMLYDESKILADKFEKEMSRIIGFRLRKKLPVAPLI